METSVQVVTYSVHIGSNDRNTVGHMSKPDLQTQLEIEKRLRSEAYVDWANQVGELHQKIQNLENALLWIADIAAKEHGDPKLRADGARTLRRIITKVEETIRINKEERILEQK